jgi:recombination protein RecR
LLLQSFFNWNECNQFAFKKEWSMQTRKNFIPQELLTLISHLKKLPGVGTRTAERFAFELLQWPEQELSSLAALLADIKKNIPSCPTCGCLANLSAGCPFCSSSRDQTLLCLIASPRDAYTIEETQIYRGLYHVIEHLLSPLDGRHASSLRVDRIQERIRSHGTKEIIIAFDSTLEGDTTALFLKQQLASLALPITRLAFGMPVGSNLEYVDASTLSRALAGRQRY